MSKLLKADFIRLFKSFIFKLVMVFSIGLGIFFVMMRYIDVRKNSEVYADLDEIYSSVDGLIFIGALYIIFAAAVLVGLFIGTEYSDGTIRNKIIISHSKTEIYISNLITCAAANVMAHLAYIATALIFGTILLEPSVLSAGKICMLSLLGCMAMIALTAILLLFSMLIQSKAVASVTALIFLIISFCATLTISNKLTQPEYYEGGYAVIDQETGEVFEVEKEKNPNYLTGTKRKVYEVLNDVIPSSQLYQIAMEDLSNMGKMVGYSAIIFVASTAAGILVFRRKDLK